MENALAHGIGVQNRYALFYDEDVDPLEILRQQEEEKQKRKTDKTQCKGKVVKSGKQPASVVSPKKPVENLPVKAAKPTENVDAANKSRGKQSSERPARNSTNFQESKDIEDRKNFRNRDDQFFNAESKERDGEFRRGRGGFRGRGGRDRGRGYFGNAENRNRRIFDRHSGSDKTGVRPVDKRDGAGPNNWGDIRSDINQRRDDTVWDEEEFDASGDKPRESGNWADDEPVAETSKFGKSDDSFGKITNEGVESSEFKENDQVPEEQVEESVREMTLDEWKREQEAKRVVPKYNLRKPGEGEDDKQWKKSYVLKKKLKDEDEEQDEDDEVEDEDFGRKGQHRQLLDIQINFSDSRRGSRGRGRGARGGPRSGGNRDVPREDRARENRGRGAGREPSKIKAGQQSAPRVDDFNDFPSLINA
ncbi:Plasminogen activator inhibitor 1 RNA-binding protein, partial [Stegodyphus mimosarum]